MSRVRGVRPGNPPPGAACTPPSPLSRYAAFVPDQLPLTFGSRKWSGTGDGGVHEKRGLVGGKAAGGSRW